MTATNLEGMRVAILVTDDFEQSELTEPKRALEAAGATALVVSPKSGEIQGMNHDEKADRFQVDQLLAEADPEQFDAALLPGGALNADALRAVPEAKNFITAIDRSGKPIAVICHGPWLLVSAKLVSGRNNQLSHDSGRPAQCRGGLAGCRGTARSQLGEQPQAGGPAGLQSGNVGVVRGASCGSNGKGSLSEGLMEPRDLSGDGLLTWPRPPRTTFSVTLP